MIATVTRPAIVTTDYLDVLDRKQWRVSVPGAEWSIRVTHTGRIGAQWEVWPANGLAVAARRDRVESALAIARIMAEAIAARPITNRNGK